MKFKSLEINVSQIEAGRAPSIHNGPIFFKVDGSLEKENYPEVSFSKIPGFVVITEPAKGIHRYFNNNNIMSIMVNEA